MLGFSKNCMRFMWSAEWNCDKYFFKLIFTAIQMLMQNKNSISSYRGQFPLGLTAKKIELPTMNTFRLFSELNVSLIERFFD